MWHVFDLKNKTVLNWGTVLKSGSWSRLPHYKQPTSHVELHLPPDNMSCEYTEQKNRASLTDTGTNCPDLGSRTLLLLSVHLGEGESGSAKFVLDSHCHQAPILPPVHCTSRDQHVNYCRASCGQVSPLYESLTAQHHPTICHSHFCTPGPLGCL